MKPTPRATRRRFLRGLGGTALALPLLGTTAWWASRSIDTTGKVTFDQPLSIPPLAPSRIDGKGRREFDLTLTAGRTEFLPGRPSLTWGINGSYLGPPSGPATARRCGSASPTTSAKRLHCTGTGCTCPPPWTADPTR